MSYNDIFANHLFERNFFNHDILQSLPPIKDPELIFNKLAALKKKIVSGDVEANLDLSFTAELLKILGWPYAYQQNFKFHGNLKIPDFFLFANAEEQQKFLAGPKDSDALKTVFSVWENKAEDVILDNGKTDRANPYFQLMEYLLFLRLPFGFLSNGHEIWYVDNSDIFSEKRYLAVNFDKLVESRDPNALRIFMGLFAYASYFPSEGEEAAAKQLMAESARRKMQSEEELSNAIYGLNGRDSLFEKCGVFLFKSQKAHDPGILTELYKNCLYFTFRLIFIAYFEDKHREILKKHPHYNSISLLSLYQHVKELVRNGDYAGYEAWDKLQTLFRTLDEGNPNLDIPLFNGGLFARQIAPMLDKPKVMTNQEVLLLLDMLYGENASGYIRDFSSLSVIQLGKIYESLLEFEFRITEENLWYFAYKEKKKKGKKESKDIVEGFFDTEDYKNIENSNKYEIISKVVEYKKGEIYLVGSKNSRKQSASYFTPESLSKPLAAAALDDVVKKLAEDESLLDLKILDNACGSGHMLVEALKYLTHLALGRIEKDKKLKTILEEEKKRIQETLEQLGLLKLGIEVDEFAVLKRILLKRTIYGVDLQAFAVELTKLSLWIESFVFGTPLSFIEHHIKSGNALEGCPISRVRKKLGSGQANLMQQAIIKSFKTLKDIFQKLSALQDSTAKDITDSKNIYHNEIVPKLEELNNYFDLLNTGDMLSAESATEKELAKKDPPYSSSPSKAWKAALHHSAAEKKKLAADIFKNYEHIAQALNDHKEDWQKIEDMIKQMRAKYHFFNWELEFPEVFATTANQGFHIIIGNPPWDKTKFSDPDFFSQYRFNYRKLNNREKSRVARELLAHPFIKDDYERRQQNILSNNEYYKENFPHSQGAGDGNLFRFFVEKNLHLLRKGGTLNYVIPTALWTDEGSTALRQEIFTNYWLRYFYGFENRKKLFDIHLSYKFGLMQLEKPAAEMPEEEKDLNACFMLTSASELQEPKRIFTYKIDDVQVTSPYWHALMEFRSPAELQIMRKIHSCGYPYLNPTWLDFRNELHATHDKKIFHEHYQEGMIPLYKGACIWQFNSEYWNEAGPKNRNEYWLDIDEFDRLLLSKERERLIDDLYPQVNPSPKKSKSRNVLDALGLKKAEDLDPFIVPDRLYPRLAFRGVASDTNDRTMVAAVLASNIGAQHSLWLSIPKQYILIDKNVRVKEQEQLLLFFAQAFFNSFIFDWVLRCSVALNVSKTFIWRMPMPQPTVKEIKNNPDFLKLTQNSLLLSAFYNEKAFLPFFGQLDLDVDFKIQDKKHANMLRRENDLLISRLYGLDKADMEVILATFTVMNKNYPGYAAALLEKMVN